MKPILSFLLMVILSPQLFSQITIKDGDVIQHSNPTGMNFSGTLSDNGRLLDGEYPVRAEIACKPTQEVLWSEDLPDHVPFNKGLFTIVIGKSESLELVFLESCKAGEEDPFPLDFKIIVDLDGSFKEINLPMSAVPFSFKARYADEARFAQKVLNKITSEDISSESPIAFTKLKIQKKDILKLITNRDEIKDEDSLSTLIADETKDQFIQKGVKISFFENDMDYVNHANLNAGLALKATINDLDTVRGGVELNKEDIRALNEKVLASANQEALDLTDEKAELNKKGITDLIEKLKEKASILSLKETDDKANTNQQEISDLSQKLELSADAQALKATDDIAQSNKSGIAALIEKLKEKAETSDLKSTDDKANANKTAIASLTEKVKENAAADELKSTEDKAQSNKDGIAALIEKLKEKAAVSELRSTDDKANTNKTDIANLTKKVNANADEEALKSTDDKAEANKSGLASLTEKLKDKASTSALKSTDDKANTNKTAIENLTQKVNDNASANELKSTDDKAETNKSGLAALNEKLKEKARATDLKTTDDKANTNKTDIASLAEKVDANASSDDLKETDDKANSNKTAITNLTEKVNEAATAADLKTTDDKANANKADIDNLKEEVKETIGESALKVISDKAEANKQAIEDINGLDADGTIANAKRLIVISKKGDDEGEASISIDEGKGGLGDESFVFKVNNTAVANVNKSGINLEDGLKFSGDGSELTNIPLATKSTKMEMDTNGNSSGLSKLSIIDNEDDDDEGDGKFLFNVFGDVFAVRKDGIRLMHNKKVIGSMTFRDNAIIEKNLTVKGSTTLEGNLTIKGNANATGLKMDVNGDEKDGISQLKIFDEDNEDAEGNVNPEDGRFVFYANGTQVFAINKEGIKIVKGKVIGKLQLANELDVEGVANFKNNIIAGLALTVAKKGHFKEALTVDGVLTASAALNVTGASRFKSNLTVDGDLEVKGEINESSDRRLKKNINSVKNILSRVMAFDAKQYHYKTQANQEKKHYGVIAQDLQPLFPELVSGEESKDSYLSVRYMKMGVLALGAIKELKQEKDAEVEALNQENETLRTMIKKLSERVSELESK